MKRTGPDSLEGCFIAVTICLISTLMYGMADLSSLLFVACITRYNTDRNRASVPFVLNAVIQATSGPFAGYFAKKFGVRVVVLIGSVLGFLGIATCFLAESILEVTILWGILFGIGFGCSTLLLPAIINEYFFKHRSKALGMSYLGSPIGFLIFPPIFEVLYNKYGLSGTFLFLSGINLHCIPLSMLLRQPNFKDGANPSLRTDTEDAYLNTNSRISHLQNLANENKTLVSNNTEKRSSFFRRYSVEFLWKQPRRQESDDNSSGDKEQYIFTLNKNHFNKTSKINDSIRSYEKRTENFYKNLSKECLVSNSSASSEFQFGSKLINEDQFKENRENSILNANKISFANSAELSRSKEDNATRLLVNAKETRKHLKGNESIALSELQSPNYRECSTIYFGTNKIIDTFTAHKQDIKCQQNIHSINGANITNDNILSCHKSSEKSNVYQSTCKTSSASVTPEEDSLPISSSNRQKKLSRWVGCFRNKSLVRMYYNPIFIVMCISNAIFSLQFTTLATVIIDFAEDHHIDPTYEKFIMMCISVMGLFGMLGFGWVTDGGYMTRHRFGSLCLLIGSISIAVLPQVNGLTTLITILSIWCVSQSSFVLLIPAILAEYLEKDIQAVAVSAANVLCGPLYLIIPPLLGYFRDGQGSYNSVFYLMSSLSLFNSILVFCVPCMARSKNEEENT